MLTFWPHPSALFRPENPTKLIQPAATKARMLNRLGVDAVLVRGGGGPVEPVVPGLVLGGVGGVVGVVVVAAIPWISTGFL